MGRHSFSKLLLPLLFVVFSSDACLGGDFSGWTPGTCSKKLSRSVLESSLERGTQFLLANQQPPGNFTYEYHWLNGTYTADDNQVRQAGALWGLALLHAFRPTEQLKGAIEKSVSFFVRHSRTLEKSGRFVLYPRDQVGSLGTVALVALGLIDYLRVLPESFPKDKRQIYEEYLREYLSFIISARRKDGHWPSRYQVKTGQAFSEPSPYFDGEALLALVKAARYLPRVLPAGFDKKMLLESADAGHTRYIQNARKADPDSSLTKGYYQWSSMVFFELSQSGWEGTSKYAAYVTDLAHWMIDVHHTLSRTRNTAYAYEGIIHAFEIAKNTGSQREVAKFACTIEEGLEKLTSWQVGGPIPNAFIASQASRAKPIALGGIQNHAREDGLRIDVAQHQMHAVILALKYVYAQ